MAGPRGGEQDTVMLSEGHWDIVEKCVCVRRQRTVGGVKETVLL